MQGEGVAERHGDIRVEVACLVDKELTRETYNLLLHQSIELGSLLADRIGGERHLPDTTGRGAVFVCPNAPNASIETTYSHWGWPETGLPLYVISIGGTVTVRELEKPTLPVTEALRPCVSSHPEVPPMLSLTPLVYEVVLVTDCGLGWSVARAIGHAESRRSHSCKVVLTPSDGAIPIGIARDEVEIQFHINVVQVEIVLEGPGGIGRRNDLEGGAVLVGGHAEPRLV